MSENNKPDPAFASRIERLCELAGGAADLAQKSGLSRRVIDKYAAGGSDPSRQRLIALAEAAGVSVQWLATGEEPAQADAQPLPSPPDAAQGFSDDFALIPRYEVNLSAGPGLLPDHEHVEERLAFSRVWLRRNGINPDHAGLVRVRGGSMAPTLPDGALALVHAAEARVDREGVYAFSREGEAFVKRLVPVAPGPDGSPTSIVIISDGGAIAPEMITGLALNELRVVGRVRCILVNM